MKTTEDFTLSDYYGLFTYIGLGGSIDQEQVKPIFRNIKRLLEEKYGKEDFRVKYMQFCLLKCDTHEFDVEDREWIRYILHAEVDPNDSHESLLEDLKERIEHSVKENKMKDRQ